MSFQDPSFAFGLCALFIADANPRACISRSLEVGNTFLMLVLKQNNKNVFRVVQFDTVMLFSFDFSLNFLKFSLATHYVACSFLLAFPQMFGVTPVAL